MKKILIVDDDEKLNNLLKDYLSKFNFKVDSVTEGNLAFKYLKKSIPDCIILDVMLPGINGFEICKKIREQYTVPIIMLTARGEVTDKIVGLEIGADDYMAKPFEPRELVARIETILRRSQKSDVEKNIKTFGNLKMDMHSYRLWIDKKEISLSANEFQLLKILSSEKDRVYSRELLFEKMKGLDSESFDRSIDVMISRIRQKLGDNSLNPKYIKTVRGIGYKFIGKR